MFQFILILVKCDRREYEFNLCTHYGIKLYFRSFFQVMRLFEAEQRRKSKAWASTEMHKLNTLMAFTEGLRQSKPILTKFETYHHTFYRHGIRVDPTGPTGVKIEELIRVTQQVNKPGSGSVDLYRGLFLVVDICETLMVR